MEFLNPLFLIGTLSAAVPLIIHLSRSRRTKTLRFSTTRFLTDQFLRSYRMSRLKELLLLAARMALCALFAIALAQPLIRPQNGVFLSGQQPRTVVLVLDNSASMGYRENDQSLLERAKVAAVELLDGLKEGDRASIVLAGRREAGPEVLFEQPTPDLGDVRQAVDALEVSNLGTDLSRAVLVADEIATSGSADGRRELDVLSDLQGNGWEALESEDRQTPTDANIVFVSIRPESVENLAITAVQHAASRPMVGIPFAIRPHVRNHSRQLADGEVELFVDGKKVGQQRVDALQAERWSVLTFHHMFENGGWHTGYVQVNDQTFDGDNRRYFAFHVLDRINVLAVNGSPSTIGRMDELFFLKAALASSSQDKSPVDVNVVLPSTLTDSDLSQYPLIVMANVESLASAAVERLESYVDKGGSLLVFLGDKTDAAFHNETLAGTNRLHGGLLPGKILSIEHQAAAEQQATYVGSVDGSHMVLAAFDRGVAGNLDSVSMQAFWKFDPGDSAVLMRTNTGLPLLCERKFGKGHVMLFASTCDRDWTNFPVRPAFLPWIYRLVGYLAQEPMGRQNFYHTGDIIRPSVSATEGLPQLLVKKPDGTVGNVGTINEAATPLAFADTTMSGIYSIYSPGKLEQAQLFVANLEAYESDLTPLEDVLTGRDSKDDSELSREEKIIQGLKNVLSAPRAQVSYVSSATNIAEASLSARRSWRLWDLALLVALGIALFEPWFANRISIWRYLSKTAS